MTNGNSSRRRHKINYNSFYNASLRTTNYLKQYPSSINTTWIPEGGLSRSFFAGVGEAVTPQPRAIQSAGVSQPFITPTTTISDLQKYYVVTDTTNIPLSAQTFEEVINEAEDGEILAIEVITDSPLITVEIVIYGMGNSPNVINDYSINDMIRRGRGLTPGDVEELPGGRSKDTTGLPLRYYPYIARYKTDVLVDYLGDTRAYYTFRYEPAVPMPYSSIIVNVKNTSTESNKVVDSVNLHRRVYESPYAEQLVGRPIESAELFKQVEAQKAQELEQQKLEALQQTVAAGGSPYIANWQKKQQEQLEAANAPSSQQTEMLEADEFL